MSANIFISFASQDLKVANTICSAIEGRGFKCWISSRDILPGENFQSAIVRAIRGSRIMLLVFTGNSNRSEEMTKELALASQQKLMVVPLRVEDVTPNDAFAYEFATRQWIDLFADWEIAMSQLCARMAAALANEPHSTDTIVLGKPTAEMTPAETAAAASPSATPLSAKSAAANAPLPFAKPVGKSASLKTAAPPATKPTARKRVGGLVIGGVAVIAAAGIAIALAGKGRSAPAPAASAPATPPAAAPAVADTSASASAARLVLAAADAPAAAATVQAAEPAEPIPAASPAVGTAAPASIAPHAPTAAAAATTATVPAVDPAKAAQRRKQRLADKAHASSNVPY